MALINFFRRKKNQQPQPFQGYGYGAPYTGAMGVDEPRLFQNQQNYPPQNYGYPGQPQGYPPQQPSFQGADPFAQSTPYFQQPQSFSPQPQQPAFSQKPAQEFPNFSAAPAANFSSSNTASPDLKELRFWDQSSVDGSSPAYATNDEENEQQPLRFVFALGILIIFAALAWVVFRWSTQTVTTAPPHIQADPNPFKVKPDNPGGMVVPHQDKLIYGRLEGDNGVQQVERLLPPPEQPQYPQQQQPYYPSQNGAVPPPNGQYQQQMAYQQQNGQMQPQQGQPYPQQGYPQQQVPPMPPQGQQAVPQQGQIVQPQTYPDHLPGEGDEEVAQQKEDKAFYPNNVQPKTPAPKEQPKESTPANAANKSNKDAAPVAQKTESSTAKENPTGFLPGTIPANKKEEVTKNTSVSPQFYKAKLATLKNKKAAESEWERLKKIHKDAFNGLNKAIHEQIMDDGEKNYVLYALGLQSEEKAKSFCKTLGNHCTYKKQ